jgi:RNA polymerase sigma factor (sigma-70 family)
MNDSALALRLKPDVIAAAGGDQRAFGRLVDYTRNSVASISLAILRDPDASADVAQDVYLSAWFDLRKLREPSSFLPWLRQLTRNRAHHVLRSDVRRRRRITNRRADEILAAASDPRPSAMDEIVAKEDRALLANAIDDLPESAREVVILYYREGQSASQVADLLGLTEDAVKQRLSRARTHLREALAREVVATAPTAAFTAAVLTAISLATPPTAAAATIVAGKVAAGKLAAKVAGTTALTSALAGATAGLLGGGAGVLFGARDLLRLARDDEERRGVIAMSGVMLLTVVGFIVVVAGWPKPLPVTLAFGGMVAIFLTCHLLWLPRITQRRHQLELMEDPVRAQREHRNRRLQLVWGCTVGVLLGGATVAASWYFK